MWWEICRGYRATSGSSNFFGLAKAVQLSLRFSGETQLNSIISPSIYEKWDRPFRHVFLLEGD